MNTSHIRRHGARTLGGTGSHTAARTLLGIAATLALLLQMVSPLIDPATPFTAFAQDTPANVAENTSDGTDSVTPSDPTPVLDEQPTVDTTAPVVNVPATIIATADASGTADVQFGDQISAVDDVDGPVAVVADPAPGAFPVGDTTVTVTATDAAGNVGTATFVVSVSAAPVPTEVPIPTDVPEPTQEPTLEPTVVPTEAPTIAPTAPTSPEPTSDKTKPEARAAAADIGVAAVTSPVTLYFAMSPSTLAPGAIFEWRKFDNQTCTPGDGNSVGTFSLTNNYYQWYNALMPGQSVSITAPTIQGYPFGAWTSTQGGGGTFLTQTFCQNTLGTSTIIGWRADYFVSATTMTATSLTGAYNGTAALSATLLTTAGTPVGGKIISFTLNGVTKTATTNSTTGIATLPASGTNSMPLTGLAQGTTHTYTATFLGDGSYPGSSATATVKIGLAATMSWGPISTTYDGLPKPITVNTSPVQNLPGVTVTYGGYTVVYGPTTTPPTDAGMYTVFAVLNNPDYAAPRLPLNGVNYYTINKASQSISFPAIGDQVMGAPDFDPGATASSGLPVTYSATPSTTCTIVSNQVHLTGVGTCTVTASRATSTNFLAATPVSRSFNVTPATTTVTITPDSGQSKVYGTDGPTLTFTNDAGLLPESFTGALSRMPGEDVGTYPINLGSLSAGTSYTLVLATTPVTFAITPATATIELVAADLHQYYDGTARSVGVITVPDPLTGVTVTYTGIDVTYPNSTTPPTDVGSYTVVATLSNPNYNPAEATGTLVISPARVATTVSLGGLTQTYDGTPKPVTVTTDPTGVESDVTVLYTGIDVTYAESATAPTNAGSYAVVATLDTMTHSGTASGTLVISPAPATIALVQADLEQYADGPEKVVGYLVTPEMITGVTVTYTGIDGTVYPASTTPPTVAGTYTVVASVTDPNYTAVDATGTLVLLPWQMVTMYYEMWGTGFGTSENVEYRIYDNATCSGDPSFIGTVRIGASYYSSEILQNIISTGQSIEVTAPTFPGYSFTSWTQLQGGNGVLTSTTVCQNAADVVDASGISAWRALYTPIVSTTLVIGNLAQTYDGTPKPVTVATTPSGQEGNVTFLYTGVDPTVYPESATPPTEAGSYTVVATLDTPTHAGSATGTLVVSPMTVTITPDSGQSKEYGTNGPVLTFTNDAGLLPDAFTGALSRMPGEDVGTYAITGGDLSAGPNYLLVLPATPVTFAITPAPVEVTATNLTKVYGTADPALTYTITAGGLVGTDAFTGALVRDPGEDVGSYPIRQGTLGLSTNYTLTFVPGTLTITPAAITVTADDQTRVYGTADPNLTYKVTSGELVGADAFTGSLIREPGTDVGSYAILQGSLDAGSNYVLTFIGGTLTITPASVTVTPDNGKTKVYGEIDPVLTYVLSPTVPVTGALSRMPGEDVGVYPIVIGSLDAGINYTLVLADPGETFAITAKPITVTADNATKVYGTADPTAFTYTTSDPLVTGDAFTGTLTRVQGDNVGSYAIQQGTLALSNNYALEFIEGTLTISARPITVTADDKEKTWSDPDPALTHQVTAGSLVGTDAISGELTRDPGEDEGTYAITQGTLTAGSNYDLTFVPGKLTILGKLTIVVAPVSATNKGGSSLKIRFEVFRNGVEITDLANVDLTLTIQGGKNYTLTVTDSAIRWDPTAGQWFYSWKIPKVTNVTYTITVAATATSATPVTSEPIETRTK